MSARKLSIAEIEEATIVEASASNWDKVRLGVRRDILYARVFNTSVRSGAKLRRLARTTETKQRGDDYYQLLAKQMARKSGLAVHKE